MVNAGVPPSTSFTWPEGKRVAVSMSFDDARASQVDRGIPILDQYGAKGTFYILPSAVEVRLAQWKAAVATGHEMGNHSVTHPCSANFTFSRLNGLEDYTLANMEEELTGAQVRIHELLGVTPTTFAYPCGQKFVGRGAHVQSYVPLVAKHFLAGRGYRDERHNSPTTCDPAQLYGYEFDCYAFSDIQKWIELAREEGGWLVLAGHEVGGPGVHQTVVEDTLHELCRYCADPANDVWLDTVAAIGHYVTAQRKGASE
jgi:peptidoglycan/xylan/chitin deacetylase (PgdA/CDA1 family)